MKVFKYLIVDEGAILFPEKVDHITVAQGYLLMKRKVYSAGFVKMSAGNTATECYGKSISLGIKSKPHTDILVVNDTLGVISKINYGLTLVKDLYK